MCVGGKPNASTLDISSHSPVPLATDKLHCHLMELEMLLTESQSYRYLKCVGQSGIRKEEVRTKQINK